VKAQASCDVIVLCVNPSSYYYCIGRTIIVARRITVVWPDNDWRTLDPLNPSPMTCAMTDSSQPTVDRQTLDRALDSPSGQGNGNSPAFSSRQQDARTRTLAGQTDPSALVVTQLLWPWTDLGHYPAGLQPTDIELDSWLVLDRQWTQLAHYWALAQPAVDLTVTDPETDPIGLTQPILCFWNQPAQQTQLDKQWQ